MKYKAIIWDLDGTILDTLEDLKDAVNYALRENGFPERSLAEVRQFVGNGILKLINRSLPEVVSEEDVENTYNIFTSYYKDHCADNTKPYDGIIELIRNLKTLGIKNAVVSNKADYAVTELCEHYFMGLFDVHIGEMENKGIRKKPAPDMVELALQKLGVDKNDAVYIGDSDVDIVTAKNSGLDSIAVTWGFRSRDFLIEHGATTLVDTPEDIIPWGRG